MSNQSTRYIIRRHLPLFFSLTCILVSSVLLFCSRRLDGFAEWYARWVFPFFPNSFGRLLSPLPFSLFEWMVYGAIFVLFFWAMITLWHLFVNRRFLFAYLRTSGRVFLMVGSLLLLIYTLTGAVNYSRTPFAEAVGLPLSPVTQEDLLSLSERMVTDLTVLESEVSWTPSGELSLTSIDLQQEVAKAMASLGSEHPSLSGYYPNLKPIAYSRGLSYLGITGIYSPFTMEANYNVDVAAYGKPYTMAHELAHWKGFMREEEAGFIAFLACRTSDSKELQYSGLLSGLQYTLRALHSEATAEEYGRIYRSLPPHAKVELEKSRRYWVQHTTAVTTFAKEANNRYLTVNAEQNGIGSYGKVVDLLMAYYEIHRVPDGYSTL